MNDWKETEMHIEQTSGSGDGQNEVHAMLAITHAIRALTMELMNVNQTLVWMANHR